MPVPVSSFSWSTPNTFSTGNALPSADLNILATDVAVAVAKPWMHLVMTAGSFIPVKRINPAFATPNAMFASGASGATGVTSSLKQNSPASGAGAFARSATTGLITPPAGLVGMYRINAQAVLTTSGGTSYLRLTVVAVNAGGTVVGAWPGRYSSGQTTGTGYHEVIYSPTALVPFGVSSFLGDTATAFYISADCSDTSGTATIGYEDDSVGPGSSPPAYFTFCEATFEGLYGTA